jgi:hypothetical protein
LAKTITKRKGEKEKKEHLRLSALVALQHKTKQDTKQQMKQVRKRDICRVLTDWIISDFIRDLIQKIMKII